MRLKYSVLSTLAEKLNTSSAHLSAIENHINLQMISKASKSLRRGSAGNGGVGWGAIRPVVSALRGTFPVGPLTLLTCEVAKGGIRCILMRQATALEMP